MTPLSYHKRGMAMELAHKNPNKTRLFVTDALMLQMSAKDLADQKKTFSPLQSNNPIMTCCLSDSQYMRISTTPNSVKDQLLEGTHNQVRQ